MDSFDDQVYENDPKAFDLSGVTMTKNSLHFEERMVRVSRSGRKKSRSLVDVS